MLKNKSFSAIINKYIQGLSTLAGIFLLFSPQHSTAFETSFYSNAHNAIAVDQGVYGNPAALGLERGVVQNLAYLDALTSPASFTTAPGWIYGYQSSETGLGLEYFQSPNNPLTRLNLGLGFSIVPSLQIGGHFRYAIPYHGGNSASGDLGVQLELGAWCKVGYFTENLWQSDTDSSGFAHFAIGFRPLSFTKSLGPKWTIGLRSQQNGLNDLQDKAQWSLFQDIQLPLGFALHGDWNRKRRDFQLGISLQVTPEYGIAYQKTRIHHAHSRELAMQTSSLQKQPALVKGGEVAILDLNKTITEEAAAPSLFAKPNEITFLDLLRRFDALDKNPRVHTVLLKLGKAKCGFGSGEEIYQRIIRLRSEGKHVVAYLEEVSPLNYYLATAAERIALQPAGYFNILGFSSEMRFYRGLFDKAGIEPQFIRHGRYKSFEEPFTRKNLSEEARANLSSLMGSLWQHYIEVIAVARKVPRDSLQKFFDAGQISLHKAVAAHLVDTLLQPDQMLEYAGGPEAHAYPFPFEGVYPTSWKPKPRLALIVLEGDIIMGQSTDNPFLHAAGHETLARQIRAAREDENIKGLILRINSPGGSAQASDLIWNELEVFKKTGKPLIATIGNVAASGGYYALCGADKVFTEPNSIVGSIGVLSGKFVLKGLYEKLGISTDGVKTAAHADAESEARPWSPQELQTLNNHMDEFYHDFVEKVSKGRHKTWDAIDSLGEGRVFTGTQAVANGLADAFGGMQEAISETLRRAGYPAHEGADIINIPSTSGLEDLNLSSLASVSFKPVSQISWLEDLIKGWSSFQKPQLWAFSPEAMASQIP